MFLFRIINISLSICYKIFPTTISYDTFSQHYGSCTVQDFPFLIHIPAFAFPLLEKHEILHPGFNNQDLNPRGFFKEMVEYRRSVYCTEQTNEEFPACDVKGSVHKCSSEVCTMKSTDLLCIITLYTFGCNLWSKACEFSPRDQKKKRKQLYTEEEIEQADVNIL